MLTLVIGNKNLSSWSLRPWLALKHLDLPFAEIKLTLDTPQFKSAISRYSNAGRVPVLMDADLAIWDSLAIVEYLNEKSDGKGWPAETSRRAHARAVSAEMHSGFAALRECWPMKAAEHASKALTPAAAQDVARVEQIWLDCRERYAAEGPWLFGAFSIADAMYAPVVLRFHTYGHSLASPAAAAYMQHALGDPALNEWIDEARQELQQHSGTRTAT